MYVKILNVHYEKGERGLHKSTVVKEKKMACHVDVGSFCWFTVIPSRPNCILWSLYKLAYQGACILNVPGGMS